MLHHVEKFNSKKVKLINFISFLFGFSYAVYVYILSFYFKESTGIENVGVFYLLSYILVLFSFLYLHKLIEKAGKTSSLYLLFALKALLAMFLAFLSPSWFTAILMIAYIVVGSASWVVIDIVLESFSVDKMSGRIRGLYLTILNTGFLFGPFLSTQLLGKYGFERVFALVFLIDFVVLLISLMGIEKVNHEKRRTSTIIGTLKRVIKRKDILRDYYISFALDFFYAGMIIYTPIYLHSMGVGVKEIGIIFTIMLVPFVVFQYPAGLLADKKTGEKNLLIFALFVMGMSVLSIVFFSSVSIVLWGVVLFCTRIGAALLEILRDSYFYKRIDGDDVDLIDFFRTTRPVAYIVFAVISGIMLSFLPIKSVFILIGLIVLLGLWPAYHLTNNTPKRK